jgi:hypothetical protein
LNEEGALSSSLAKDSDSALFSAKTSSSNVTAGAWAYVVFSAALSASTKESTDVTFFIDNVAAGTATIASVFHIDSSAYRNFIAIRRNYDSAAATNYVREDWWNGFMYEFHVYQSAHNVSNDAHFLEGCSGTKCWKANFDQYEEATVANDCDVSCANKSCVRAGRC